MYAAYARLRGGTATQRQGKPVTVGPWPHGLNLLPPHQLSRTEVSACTNFFPQTRGTMMTRPPAVPHISTTVAGDPTCFFRCLVGDTYRELTCDNAGRLYYSDDGTQTLIGTLEAQARIVPYKAVALLADGSYLKYIDDVSEIKLAYDDGTGTTGYQANNRTGTADTTLALGNGTNTRVAYKFTSQAWTAGYTIPPTTVTAKLSKVGTPHASAVTCNLRKVSDSSVVATATLVAVATSLTGTAAEIEADFTVTAEMTPSTAYYLSVEHSGGDGANYVAVHCTTVASGGTAYAYAGSWSADTAKTPIMSIRPGRPPKADMIVISDLRPWVRDPDEPGLFKYGYLTFLDWSTDGGGGSVGAIDDNATSHPIGGAAMVYDDLFVWGTANAPYICKLTGTGPDDWALPSLYQHGWSTADLVVATPNDGWFASSAGVHSLSGVQAYGDLRQWSFSGPVQPILAAHFDGDTARMAYDPEHGLIWLVMPTYHRCLTCAIDHPVQELDGSERVRYPWAEQELTRAVYDATTYAWEPSANGTNEYYLTTAAGGDPGISRQPDFILIDGVKSDEGTAGSLADHEWDWGDNDTLGYSTLYLRANEGDPATSGAEVREVFLPTGFGTFGGYFYVCVADGTIARLDRDYYRDMQTDDTPGYRPRYELASLYLDSSGADMDIDQAQLHASGTGGGQLDVDFFVDDALYTPVSSTTRYLPIDDRLTAAQLTMLADDAWFMANPVASPKYFDPSVVGRSVMARLHNIYPAGYPLYISGISLRIRRLS